MKKLAIEVYTTPQGQSFNFIISVDDKLFAKGNLQGDMVHDRIVDVLNPHLRLMSNELDKALKQLRKGEDGHGKRES